MVNEKKESLFLLLEVLGTDYHHKKNHTSNNLISDFWCDHKMHNILPLSSTYPIGIINNP